MDLTRLEAITSGGAPNPRPPRAILAPPPPSWPGIPAGCAPRASLRPSAFSLLGGHDRRRLGVRLSGPAAPPRPRRLPAAAPAERDPDACDPTSTEKCHEREVVAAEKRGVAAARGARGLALHQGLRGGQPAGLLATSASSSRRPRRAQGRCARGGPYLKAVRREGTRRAAPPPAPLGGKAAAAPRQGPEGSARRPSTRGRATRATAAGLLQPRGPVRERPRRRQGRGAGGGALHQGLRRGPRDQQLRLSLFMLEKGRGVAKDVARAVALYTRACDADYAKSCTTAPRHLVLASGRGVPKDEARAGHHLYEKACDGGERRRLHRSSVSSRPRARPRRAQGRGRARRPSTPGPAPRAISVACAALGVLFSKGRGVPQDEARAAASLYTRRPRDGGRSLGCANLGVLLGERQRGSPRTRRAR